MKLFPTSLDPRWWSLKKRFASKYGGPFSEINNEGYVIAIVSRGEQLLYEDLSGIVKVSISLHDRCIDARTLGLEVSAFRRKLVLNRLELYFKKYQGYSVRVIES